MRIWILFFIGLSICPASYSQESANEERLTEVLQAFTGQSVNNLRVTCAPSRGPASTNQVLALEYQTRSGKQTLQFFSENNKTKSVALVGNSIEFSRWKTFIPEDGQFRIDAAGVKATVSELIFNSNKPTYLKALEQLAPQVLNCCSQQECKSNLGGY